MKLQFSILLLAAASVSARRGRPNRPSRRTPSPTLAPTHEPTASPTSEPTHGFVQLTEEPVTITTLEPTAGPTPSTSTTGVPDANDWLEAHNSRRAAYHEANGLEPSLLKWSESMAQSAQEYAELLVELEVFDHCIGGCVDMGENLGAGWGGPEPPSAEQALTGWWDDYMNEGAENGHFVQVGWYSSHYLGCGQASKQLDDDTWYHVQVCRYLQFGWCITDDPNMGLDCFGQMLQESCWYCGTECPEDVSEEECSATYGG